MNSLSIDKTTSAFEIEPLSHPYGFKGGQTTLLWQILAQIQDKSGNKSIGSGRPKSTLVRCACCT